MRMTRAILAGLMILAVAACSSDRDIKLRKLVSQGDGPDEFSILPSKPLQAPADFRTLPEPLPGGRNLTDQFPQGDAVASLGGRAEALLPGAVPASDAALVTQASRRGVPQDIRATLAAEDRDYRQRRGTLQRWRIFVRNKYNEAYSDQTLDSWETNQQYRRAGVPTPSAPPGR